jgi:hypothetical protein
VQEQRFHFLAECGVAGTLLLQESRTVVALTLERRVVDRFDLPPPVG